MDRRSWYTPIRSTRSASACKKPAFCRKLIKIFLTLECCFCIRTSGVGPHNTARYIIAERVSEKLCSVCLPVAGIQGAAPFFFAADRFKGAVNISINTGSLDFFLIVMTHLVKQGSFSGEVDRLFLVDRHAANAVNATFIRVFIDFSGIKADLPAVRDKCLADRFRHLCHICIEIIGRALRQILNNTLHLGHDGRLLCSFGIRQRRMDDGYRLCSGDNLRCISVLSRKSQFLGSTHSVNVGIWVCAIEILYEAFTSNAIITQDDAVDYAYKMIYDQQAHADVQTSDLEQLLQPEY